MEEGGLRLRLITGRVSRSMIDPCSKADATVLGGSAEGSLWRRGRLSGVGPPRAGRTTSFSVAWGAVFALTLPRTYLYSLGLTEGSPRGMRALGSGVGRACSVRNESELARGCLAPRVSA